MTPKYYSASNEQYLGHFYSVVQQRLRADSHAGAWMTKMKWPDTDNLQSESVSGSSSSQERYTHMNIRVIYN